MGYHVSLSHYLDSKLRLRALPKVISDRYPLPGCMHHSGQGAQCASSEYVNELQKHCFRTSIARKGNHYDNAVSESFLSCLAMVKETGIVSVFAGKIPFHAVREHGIL